MVVAHAVQRLDIMPPNRFQAHAHAWRVEVRLERDDLGVFSQRGVRVKLLFALIRLDVDVDAVAHTKGRSLIERFVAWRKELESEFKMRLRFAAIGVNMSRG